jgi:phage-related protein
MADAKLQILLDLQDNLSKGLNDAADSIKGIEDRSKQLQPVFEKAAQVGTAGFLAIGAAIYGSISAASESETVQSQLAAVLESTHGAAGLYIEDLNDQANALQRITKFGDEAIGSAQSLLLTFTNIKGPIFQEATQTILDMSTALGQDLKSSAIQLGKALNDPINGVTALQRVGVSFTDSQKEVIASLVEAGKTEEAQTMILKELNTEFGGSAVAAGKTFAGQMVILKNRIDNLMETIGGQFIPIIQKIGEKLEPVISWIEKFVTENPKLSATILMVAAGLFGFLAIVGAIGLILPSLIAGFTALGAVFGVFGTILGVLMGPIGFIVLAIAGLVAAGVAIYKNWEEISTFGMEIWNGIVSFLTQVWEIIKGIFMFHVALIAGIVKGFFDLLGIDIGAVMNGIKAIWSATWGAIKEFIIPIITDIQTAITDAFDWIEKAFTTVSEPVSKIWKSLWEGIGGIVETVWGSVKSVVTSSINFIIDKINSLIRAINSVASSGAGALGISIPQIPEIPRLAKGGIVTGPTFAMIGEAGPEAVIPLSSRGLAGAGGFGNINITITGNTFMDDREAAMKIGSELVRYLKDNLQL